MIYNSYFDIEADTEEEMDKLLLKTIAKNVKNVESIECLVKEYAEYNEEYA